MPMYRNRNAGVGGVGGKVLGIWGLGAVLDPVLTHFFVRPGNKLTRKELTRGLLASSHVFTLPFLNLCYFENPGTTAHQFGEHYWQISSKILPNSIFDEF